VLARYKNAPIREEAKYSTLIFCKNIGIPSIFAKTLTKNFVFVNILAIFSKRWNLSKNIRYFNIVMSWPSAFSVLSWMTCQADLSNLTSFSCPVPDVSDVLSHMSVPRRPVSGVQPRGSCPRSCPFCPVKAVLPRLFWHGCRVSAVLSQLPSCPTVATLFWSHCPVFAVIS
jgi:hypothetical protein